MNFNIVFGIVIGILLTLFTLTLSNSVLASNQILRCSTDSHGITMCINIKTGEATIIYPGR